MPLRPRGWLAVGKVTGTPARLSQIVLLTLVLCLTPAVAKWPLLIVAEQLRAGPLVLPSRTEAAVGSLESLVQARVRSHTLLLALLHFLRVALLFGVHYQSLIRDGCKIWPKKPFAVWQSVSGSNATPRV